MSKQKILFNEDRVEVIREDKVWGRVIHCCSPDLVVSSLSVKEGFQSSRHKHNDNWNNFFVPNGVLRILFYSEDSNQPYHKIDIGKGMPGTDCMVRPGIWHRFQVIESGSVTETYWTTNGKTVDLEDIVRADVGGQILEGIAG